MNTNKEVNEFNAMLNKVVNYMPLVKKFIPGKLVTFGEGHPVAEVVSQPAPNLVKIKLIQELPGVEYNFPVGYVIEVPTNGVRYLE